MNIEVKQYEPPVEKTYITTEHFFVVDELSNIALRVVGDKAIFQAWDSTACDYNTRAFACRQHEGLNIDVIQALLEAYNNRGK